MPQLVRVRKYEVDCERLCDLLREHKKLAGKSNRALAEALDMPITKVEHWFRRDDSFAIPGDDVWDKLKKLLGITSTEFDEAITTFEERAGVYEKSERCYFAEGIAPTLTSTSAGNEKIIVEDGKMNGTATFVNGDICKTVRVGGRGSVDGRHSWDMIECNKSHRIRKLTPMECFRLMGFDDSDFEKAKAVNSDTQLYKQAGNSIVVPVVQCIMTVLFDCGALVK